MKIVISNTSHGAYKGVVQEIKKHLDAQSENVVLAPDRFTAFVERGLISTLELESTFGIEVMSFTRLANKLIGKDIKKCLTPEGSVMLISKVILDVKDKLSYYKNVTKTDGFASELYAALTALRNSGATAESLREKAQKIEDGTPLKAKLLDISLIYAEYLVQLEENHSDSSTRLVALAEYLSSHPESVANKRFYCTDIYEFSSPELEILRSIDKYALSLTIGVTSGYDNPNKRIYPDRVIAKLKSICDGKAEIVRNDETLSPPIEAVSRWLFSYSLPKARVENRDENGNEKIVLRVAKDRYDEILKLALDVSRHVREGGRYKDIEVFVSDMDSYQAEIKAVFSRYGIPFFIDQKELLSEQTKVRYLLSALAVVRSGFRCAEVIDFVKNPLFFECLENGEEEVFLFENYVLKYNVDHSRFLSPFELDDRYGKSHNQEFKFEELDEKTRFMLESEENVVPERVRQKLVETLVKINFKGVVQTSEITSGCKQLLIGVNEAWKKHVEKLAEISMFYEKCAEQVDQKIDAVLDEIDDVIKGARIVSEFEAILKSMIKTLKIALVPTYLDCVFVGSFDSRFMGGMDVYVLGAVSGKLPSSQGGGVVINPNDEEALESLGVEVSPTSYQKIMTGMYAVCDIMKKPHGKLVVSYPEIADGAFMKPSVVISELMGILSLNSEPIKPERIDFEHLSKIYGDERIKLTADLFATKRGTYHEVLRSALPSVSPSSSSSKVLPEELLTYGTAFDTLEVGDKTRFESFGVEPERINVRRKALPTTSVSRLEKFYSCPYQHYFAYILSLKERQEGEFLGTENGTILHCVLEQLFTDIRDGKVDDETLDGKCDVYFDLAVKEKGYEYLYEKPHTRRALLRLKRESATMVKNMFELSKRSSFKPYLLEAKIGKEPILPLSIIAGEKKVGFKGDIDRIDVKDDDFLIVDYKTFNATSDLKELYYGQKIQLYIYMKAVENSLKKRPVGVMYLPILDGFVKKDERKYVYQGQFLNDDAVLEALDEKYATSKTETVLPLTPTGKLSANVFLEDNVLDKLGDYALAVAAKGEEAIENGFIKPFPVRNKCNKCDYKDICDYYMSKERAKGTVGLGAFDLTEEEEEETI
ncbi:MAG: exodeoxyribonuclease V subunit gamma [Clostridia bacterium]|nr:exodeoxyribonuclease V subunit gamma [Clostridia bacterium]